MHLVYVIIPLSPEQEPVKMQRENLTYMSYNGLPTYQRRLFSCRFLVITEWNLDDPKSHILGRFGYEDGKLSVPRNGRYYVYMQMYFRSRPDDNKNRIALYADDRILLMIHKSMSPAQDNTGFAGGVFQLERGEKLYVKVLAYDTNLWLGPNHCYFGGYWI